MTLRIAIPVMLHRIPEIKAFLEAKKRLEKTDIEVGVFLYYNKDAMAHLKEQVENQKKFKLPIFHAQAPVWYENSLASKKGDVEKVLEQAAKLTQDEIPVETHPGVLVFREKLSRPATFTVEEFLSKRESLLNQMSERFRELDEIGKKLGVKFSIENGHAFSVMPDYLSGKVARYIYTPFNDIACLRKISGEGKCLVFDIAHHATAIKAIDMLEGEMLSNLLRVYDAKSKNEFVRKFGSIKEKLNDSVALHLSNVTGPGIMLDDSIEPELEKIWGKDGTIKGVLTKKQMLEALNHAKKSSIPVVPEIDFDIKQIPKDKFRQVDELLGYLTG